MAEGNGWQEYRLLVLKELEDLNNDIAKLQDRTTELEKRVAESKDDSPEKVSKVGTAKWSAIATGIGAAIGAALSAIVGK